MRHIAIFGVPRSGTSWLGQLFNSSSKVAYRYQPLFSYEFKNRIKEDSSRDEIDLFFKDLLDAQTEFVLQTKSLSGKINPIFKKEKPSHLVFKEVRYLNLADSFLEKSDCKLIYIVRDPRAVIWSWLNAPREFDPSWNIYYEWKDANSKNLGKIEEYYGVHKWVLATKSFLKLQAKFPERVSVVQYEDLVCDTENTLANLFKFAKLDLEDQTLEFIDASSKSENDDPYGVYRKNINVNEWKDKLSENLADEISSYVSSHKLDNFLL